MIDIVHLLMAIITGSLSGLLIGIIPGMATMHFLFLFWMILQDWPAVSIMAFYISIITVSQYVDIIPSVFFGVPGETGAIPAAREGPKLMSHGMGLHTIKACAIGRATGTLIMGLFTVWVISLLMSFPGFFSNRVMVGLFVLAILGVVISGSNRWYINIMLGVIGFGVGMIGFNHHTNHNILTFGVVDLTDGIPLMPLVIGIYAIPTLWMHVSGMAPFRTSTIMDQQREMPMKSHLPVIGRSSVIGYIAGLVPGLSYVLSSTAAYTFEKWWQRNNVDAEQARVHQVVASETGNSVGAFSTLIPLLLFGIPITGSEALIFNLMAEQGAVFDQGRFLITFLPWLLLALFLSMSVALLVSWPLSRRIASFLSKVNWRWLAVSIIVLLIAITCWTAYNMNLVALYLSVLLIAVGVGFVLKSTDTLPLVFVFLMQDSMESAFFNFIRIFL